MDLTSPRAYESLPELGTSALAVEANRDGSWFLRVLFLVLAASCYVMIEPAPADLGLVGLFVVALLTPHIGLDVRPCAVGVALIAALTLGNLISMLQVTDDLAVSARFFAITLYLCITWVFFAGIIRRYGEQATSTILGGYVAGALVSVLFGGLAYFGLIPFQDALLFGGRVKSLFKDPNVFGPFLVPAALFALAMLSRASGVRRVGWVVAFLACSAGIVLSFSRGAWANYAVAIAAYLGGMLHVERSAWRVVRYIALVLAMAVALGWWSARDVDTQSLLAGRASYQEYDDDRFSNQAVALSLALDNPFGIGPGQYEDGSRISTHNVYLRVWVENGILGLVGFAGLMAASFLRSARLFWRTRDRVFLVTACAIIGMAANGIVVDSIHWRHLWLVTAIPWGYSYAALGRDSNGC